MNRQLFLILLLVFVVLLVGAFLYQAQRSRAAAQHACDGLRLAAFGDSLVAGYGAQTPGGFVAFLSERSGTPIGNFGHNGDTSADALARLNTLTASQPQVVLVLLGGNDALQKIPQDQTKANLAAVITKLQAAHAQVVLLGVLGGVPLDPYAGMFSALAKEFHVHYVPNVLSGLIGNTQYMSDEVHPNEAGYQRVADKVYPALTTACEAARAGS